MRLLISKKLLLKIFFLLLLSILLLVYIHFKYWNYKWQEDLTALKQEYIHKDIQLNSNHKQALLFIQELDNVSLQLSSYYPDNDQVKIGILRALTRAGKLHNSMQFSDTKMLPFRLYLQDDKLYVVTASSTYSQTLYTEMIEINGHSTTQIIQQLRTIIPHDHEQDLKGMITSYILLPDILHGLQFITNKDQVPLTFLDSKGTVIHLTADAIPISNMRETLRSSEENNSSSPLVQEPNYSLSVMNKEHVLYLDYNSCADDPNYPAVQLMIDVQDRLHNLDIHKFIIDLRGNSGGDENVMLPLFEILKNSCHIGQTVIVLVDRQTASSALFHAITLRNELHAVIIGEPAMGDPNAPGDILPFTLPKSKLVIYYCTQKFHRAPYPVLNPDVLVVYTVEDMRKGTDPALQTALH